MINMEDLVIGREYRFRYWYNDRVMDCTATLKSINPALGRLNLRQTRRYALDIERIMEAIPL